jgi:hypothetical protein
MQLPTPRQHVISREAQGEAIYVRSWEPLSGINTRFKLTITCGCREIFPPVQQDSETHRAEKRNGRMKGREKRECMGG